MSWQLQLTTAIKEENIHDASNGQNEKVNDVLKIICTRYPRYLSAIITSILMHGYRVIA